ncbi:MAG: hypothetical protein FK732_05925 [Asgard group archaeon]|jgi:hypothetical protein|nr:hypothetical protein [Asgard group archaeon]
MKSFDAWAEELAENIAKKEEEKELVCDFTDACIQDPFQGTQDYWDMVYANHVEDIKDEEEVRNKIKQLQRNEQK